MKKPLTAVSAVVDEGNVVVFGPGPWGSFIQNVQSGEKIFMERKKGTYIIKVKYDGKADRGQKGPKDDGGRRAMDIGATEEEPARDSVFTGRK